MDVNFELYKIFYHAAKYKNFSDAAKQLFISQSAVSQAIKNLEEKMGSALFYRKSRSVELTQEGTLLFSHVEQAYNFLKTAENKISQMQNMDCGEVRIGVSDTICKYYLISYLGK
jgi:DNA-binding transcriptional LysR family regulator